MATRTLIDELDLQLNRMVQTLRQYPPGSVERQRGMTQMIRLIQQSNRLWHENSDYYEDALQQTWLFFCRNLLESNTGEAYNSDRASIITWLNQYLKWRLCDFRQKAKTLQKLTVQTQRLGDSCTIQVIDLLPAPKDVPPILEQTKNWVEADPEGELQKVHVQGHPHVNCQVLIMHRLPPETSWQCLSQQFKLPVSTLSSFYQRQCLPRLRKFGLAQRYL